MMTTAAASSTVMVPQGRGGQVIGVGPGTGGTSAFNKGNSPSFSDLVDIINPLQHIPVVNTIYRAITGDHESAFADVVGGAIYGGPIGAGLAMADLGLRDTTGGTVGEHVMASLGFGTIDKPKASDTAVAQASQPAAQAAAATAQAKTLTASPQAKVASATASPQTKAAAKINAAEPALTSATLVPNDIGKPADAAMASAPSPYAAPAKATMPDGPVTAGDYLVFGGTGPLEQAAAAPTPEVTVKPLAAATPLAPAGPKEFATLGANAQPPTSLPDTTSVTPATKVAAVAANQPRMFKVPPRTGPAAPPVVLPPPTTGPGALPGGKSMALTAQEAAVQNDPQHNFLTAYTQALDKYRNAQRLAAQNAGTDPSAPALLQPAAAMTPADAVSSAMGHEPAVVLH